ncbi:MAG: M42 family metallopeptidase [Chloroflexota bacterium]
MTTDATDQSTPSADALRFLVDLLDTPGPTGYTHEAIALCENWFGALVKKFDGATLSHTRKGALKIHIPGRASTHPVAVTAHVDTLGLMVKEIKSSGRLKVTKIGGIMWGGIEMAGVTVRTAGNKRIRGTVVPVNGAVHVNRDVHKMPRNGETLEIRLDIRTTKAEETREHGIEVGDFVFLDARVETNDEGFIRSRFLDDRASIACIYAALEQINETPAQDTTILIANYEEVGHGGASDFDADLFELLAVDMAAIGNGQNSDEFHCSICVKDSSGPYHFQTIERLRRLAKANDIDVKTDIYPYYSSDASAYWFAGGAARTGLIGPGVDTSHSYERTHTDAIRDTAKLIAAYLQDDPAVQADESDSPQ